MNKCIEFYGAPDGSVSVKQQGKPVFVYEPQHKQLTDDIVTRIRELYPQAYKALSSIYSKSERNGRYFEYLIAHRFIRCNFGEHDSMKDDIDKDGRFNFEEVRCPLRGECRHEGVICKPRLQTKLSERELEVAKLFGRGLCRQEVADELSISVYTVNRHVANIKERMGFAHTEQIIAYFHEE